MNVQHIKEKVFEIRNSNVLSKKDVFADKYPEFVRDCPKLFDAACDNNFPLTFLDMMCEQIVLLDKNHIERDDADKKIFTSLNKTYIEPLTEKGDIVTVTEH